MGIEKIIFLFTLDSSHTLHPRRAMESTRADGAVVAGAGAAARAPAAAVMQTLPIEVVYQLCHFIGAEAAHTSLCVLSRYWWEAITSPKSEPLWKALFARDFGAAGAALQKDAVRLPAAHDGPEAPALPLLREAVAIRSWRTVWARHRKRRLACTGRTDGGDGRIAYGADQQCEMLRCWASILRFCAANGLEREIDSLEPGARQADLEQLRVRLGVPILCPDVVAFYSVCSGQRYGMVYREDSPLVGLLGGTWCVLARLLVGERMGGRADGTRVGLAGWPGRNNRAGQH